MDAPANLVYGQADRTLTWSPSAYAICYVIIDENEQVVGFTTDSSFTTDGQGTTYTVRAVNEYGSLSQPATASITTGVNNVLRSNGNDNVVYNMQGIRLNNTVKGVNIVRTTMADGSVITRKVCQK